MAKTFETKILNEADEMLEYMSKDKLHKYTDKLVGTALLSTDQDSNVSKSVKKAAGKQTRHMASRISQRIMAKDKLKKANKLKGPTADESLDIVTETQEFLSEYMSQDKLDKYGQKRNNAYRRLKYNQQNYSGDSTSTEKSAKEYAHKSKRLDQRLAAKKKLQKAGKLKEKPGYSPSSMYAGSKVAAQQRARTGPYAKREDEVIDVANEILNESGIIAATKQVSSKVKTRTKTNFLHMGPNAMRAAGPIVTTENIQAGVYDIREDQNGIFFEVHDVKTDEILRFEDSRYNTVLTEIDRFWKLKPKFQEMDISHKRGILLHGKPGTGKSCLLKLVMESVVNDGNIVLITRQPGALVEALNDIREVEPDRPILCILEDMDTIIQYNEHAILELFDGDSQQDNILLLGTTNYINRLPPRILREGRFDRKIEVKNPPPAGRKAYFEAKFGKVMKEGESVDIDHYVALTKEFSFGQLREFLVSVHCLGEDADVVAKRIRFGELNEGMSEAYFNEAWNMQIINEGSDRFAWKAPTTDRQKAAHKLYKQRKAKKSMKFHAVPREIKDESEDLHKAIALKNSPSQGAKKRDDNDKNDALKRAIALKNSPSQGAKKRDESEELEESTKSDLFKAMQKQRKSQTQVKKIAKTLADFRKARRTMEAEELDEKRSEANKERNMNYKAGKKASTAMSKALAAGKDFEYARVKANLKHSAHVYGKTIGKRMAKEGEE